MSNKQLYAPVREFLRNYREFAIKHETIIITKNGKPEGVYVPFSEWEKRPKKITITPEFIKKYMFKGPPNLSQTIDDIYK